MCGPFFPPRDIADDPSLEGTSKTHRYLFFPKVYCCIVNCLKLVKMQNKVDWSYILQLLTVDSNFEKIKPSKLFREATSVTHDQDFEGVTLWRYKPSHGLAEVLEVYFL